LAPAGNGRMMPGTGCIVASIETASCRTAFNVGKGGSWLLPFLCSVYNVEPHQACIVGDRLDTDIALGKAGGLRTVLPLTGVTTQADLQAADADMLPDFVVPTFGALLGC
jgi:ribonucleotide monophosphatase NagD (HAD superfamily)